MNAKQGQYPYWRSNSNNSVNCTSILSLPDEFWEGYQGNGEPYGLVNIDLCRRAGRIPVSSQGHDFSLPLADPDVVCVNPCVTGETRVMTEVGPVPIALLAAGPDAWPTQLTLAPRYVQVHGLYWALKNAQMTRRAASDVVRLETEEGYSLRATSDHKVMALRKDAIEGAGNLLATVYTTPRLTSLASLQAGDKVILNRTSLESMNGWPGYVNLEGTMTSPETCMAVGYALGFLIGDGVLTPISSPAAGDYQVAQFRAYVSGEQAAGGRCVFEDCMATIDVALVAVSGDAAAAAAKCWVENYNSKDDVTRVEFLQVIDRAFVSKVCAPLGIVHGNKHVTDAVESCNSTFQIGVVAGLFDTDGSACLASNHVKISQEHLPSLQVVQRILLNHGIASSIGQTHRNDLHRRPCYDLKVRPEHIRRFIDSVPVRHTRKLDLLDAIVRSREESTTRVVEPSLEQDVLLHRATVSRIVAEDEPSDVYDITVAGLHVFAGNGLIVANCGVSNLSTVSSPCLSPVPPPRRSNHCVTLRRAVLRKSFYQIARASSSAGPSAATSTASASTASRCRATGPRQRRLCTRICAWALA